MVLMSFNIGEPFQASASLNYLREKEQMVEDGHDMNSNYDRHMEALKEDCIRLDYSNTQLRFKLLSAACQPQE